ncbi:MAG: hypothetical protein IJX56_01390 [Alistipes sp.]|nr:hypothetical protein [Alistipes sp.]
MPEVLDEVYSILTVHCNFGWGGLCDGYYNALQSFDLSIGGTADPDFGDIQGNSDSIYNTNDSQIITY